MTAMMANLSFASPADKLVPAAGSYRGLVQRKLVEASVSEDLTPASSRNLGNVGKPVRGPVPSFEFRGEFTGSESLAE